MRRSHLALLLSLFMVGAATVIQAFVDWNQAVSDPSVSVKVKAAILAAAAMSLLSVVLSTKVLSGGGRRGG